MTDVPGRFVWHDLMTTDKDSVIPFYRELFGWTYQSVDMGSDLGSYQIIHAGDQQIGGLVDLDPGAGLTSHWIGYVSVEDVDDAEVASIKAGGTQRVEAIDIPSVGRFAVIADPDGATISPFRRSRPVDLDLPDPNDGQFCWDELRARDRERCKNFYSRVFGWSHKEEDMGEVGIYTLFSVGGKEVAGLLKIPDGQPQRPVWLPYVQCSDIDDRLSEVGRLGGKTWVLPTDLQEVGRVTIARDPGGALFGLLQPASRPQV